jgi:hypothetical protein
MSDIGRWWTWLTVAGVRLTNSDLTLLRDAGANELSPADKQWLTDEMENPPSLAHQCIYLIRRQLVMADQHGRSIHPSIDKLPLPNKLKRQLKLQNVSDITFSDLTIYSDKRSSFHSLCDNIVFKYRPTATQCGRWVDSDSDSAFPHCSFPSQISVDEVSKRFFYALFTGQGKLPATSELHNLAKYKLSR